jgi:hypothetical protein
MVDFDKFEKLVKEKYGEQEFPFDEANWEKASKMIDASRQGKNRGGIILWSALTLLLTTGSIAGYFIYNSGSEAIQKSTVASNRVPQDQEPMLNTSNSTETPASETNSSNVPVDETSKTGETPTPASSGIKDQSTTIKNSSIQNTNSTSNNNDNINTSSKTNPEPEAKENSTTSKPSTSETKTNADASASDKTATKPSSKNPAKNTTRKPQPSNTGKTTLPGVLGAQQTAANSKNTNQNPGGETNGNRTGDDAPASADPNKTGTVTDSTNAVITVAIKPVEESKLTDSSETIAQLPVDSFKIPAAAALKGDGISYATNVKLEHEHKTFLFMEAGATYLLGWNGSGQNEASGFNVVGGLNVQHYFTPKISALIGAQYSTISNLTNTTHTISTVKYDFGMQQDVTAIKYQKLHYVVVPVKVSYTVKKNIFGIGCNVGYLLNSDSKKEKYTTFSSDPNANKSNLSSTKESGYVQGFNPFDIQASAFYRRKLYKGLSANAEFIFGLTDTKNNDFFKTNSFDRNVGFKLTLCYDLFKK